MTLCYFSPAVANTFICIFHVPQHWGVLVATGYQWPGPTLRQTPGSSPIYGLWSASIRTWQMNIKWDISCSIMKNIAAPKNLRELVVWSSFQALGVSFIPVRVPSVLCPTKGTLWYVARLPEQKLHRSLPALSRTTSGSNSRPSISTKKGSPPFRTACQIATGWEISDVKAKPVSSACSINLKFMEHPFLLSPYPATSNSSQRHFTTAGLGIINSRNFHSRIPDS